jgi:tRNA (adenine57-N1/adenine58-N1)-methyltransferase
MPTRPADDRWQEGDLAVLLHAARPPTPVLLARGPARIGDGGVIDLTDQIGAPVGGRVVWLGEPYRLVRPSLPDRLALVRRGAQIVGAKDAAALIQLAGIGPGARVAEAGSGSGALTIALAHAVGPDGRIFSYDRRRDFLDAAAANVARAGFDRRVEFRERDVGERGFDVDRLDAIVLDLPEPWAVVGAGEEALSPGGYLATYTPTYNQLERTVRALRDRGFGDVRALERLERGLHVGDGGTRPEFEMLGHTGFLAAGRKVT